MSIYISEIGPLINAYQGRRIRIKEVITAILLITILCAIPFFVGLYRTVYGYAQYGPTTALPWGFPWLFFSFVCFLLILIYCINRLNIARISVFLHKNGVVIHKSLRKDRILIWNDISEIYVIQEQLRRNRESHSTKMIIYTNDDDRLSFRDSIIEKLPELLTQIKASVYVHLYPRIRVRFLDGEVLSFGPLYIQKKYIKINKMGIKKHSPQIPWKEINRITVRSGQLLIKLNNKTDYRIRTANIPNLEILLGLINDNTRL